MNRRAVHPGARARDRWRRLGLESLERRDVPATASAAVTARLGPASDPDGNGVALRSLVAIVGQAPPRSVVVAEVGGHRVGDATRADAAGRYRLLEVVPIGRTTFTVAARNRTGDLASMSLMVTRGDILIDWNTTLLNAIRTAATNPPMAARNLAMVQVAMYDAIDAIQPGHALYDLAIAPPRGASAIAAADQAAYQVAASLYPGQGGTLAATLAETLSIIPPGVGRARGIAFGRAVGDAILTQRADDGANTTVPLPTATGPGAYVPTPPKFAPYLAPQFAFVRPFSMTSPSQFLPPPPPALGSATYEADLKYTESLGAVDSTTRTPDETAAAHFWSDLSGTSFTPPGHWNQIAQDTALTARMPLAAEARMFATLDIALADAGIASWNAKYVYDRWRPVTAIRATDDPTWTPLWATPPFPSYTSGHSAFSAAAATVLDSFFGTHYAFTDRGDPTEALPSREFSGFDQAAAEAGMSRIWGGIHFRSDNTAGLAQGAAVGEYVLQHELR